MDEDLPVNDTDDNDAGDAQGTPIRVEVPDDTPAARIDKVLAPLVEPHGLSRSRLRALIEAGQLSRAGPKGPQTLRDPSSKARGGEAFEIIVPPPAPATPEPENIPLTVVYEDDALIVVNKPPGMVVHPAPGAWTGTLVNALLHHCGDTLSGIGGEKRPGIVHRIDKDTSGLLVVAKSDLAHRGLAEQFAAHDLERSYLALVWGTPTRADPRIGGMPSVSFEPGWTRIETTIGRSRSDRKKMAVNIRDGRHAVTRFSVRETLGPCSLVECRLETGRTHQIRVHMAHLGYPIVGDQTYGRQRSAPMSMEEGIRAALSGFPRQALHAATLGFIHPINGEDMRFESAMPDDIAGLANMLRD